MLVNLFGIAKSTTTWIMVALLAVVVIVVIVLPMFTNKKRNKTVNELHNSLRAGDVIKTVGGVVGTIKAINEISPVDKEMVIETGVGDNKSTMVFDIQAVYQVVSKVNAPVEAPVAPVAPIAEPVAPIAEPVAEEVAPIVEDTTPIAEEPAKVDAILEDSVISDNGEAAVVAEKSAPVVAEKKPTAAKKPTTQANSGAKTAPKKTTPKTTK